MTEKEKMLQGKLYDPSDKELSELRLKAHDLSREYNTLSENDERRKFILKELIPNSSEGVYLQGPVNFDYGFFTYIGKNSYANFNFTVLDCAEVKIGENVFFGPNCSIYTPVHPLLYAERNQFIKPDGNLGDNEYALPVTIENNCWIAGNVTICGGVTIGEGSVIGAGSVVTKSIPNNSFAVGVPCRVIKEITEKDSVKYKKELF